MQALKTSKTKNSHIVKCVGEIIQLYENTYIALEMQTYGYTNDLTHTIMHSKLNPKRETACTLPRRVKKKISQS